LKNIEKCAKNLMLLVSVFLAYSCKAKLESKRTNALDETNSLKTLDEVEKKDGCVEADLSKVSTTESFTLCDGSIGVGKLDLSLLIPGNLKSGVVIGAVTGSYTGLSEICTASGAVGCITTAAFKSIQIDGLAANVKRGVDVAGVVGTYPSENNLLEGADDTPDLTTNTFADKIKQSATFEYFDGKGTRHTGAGDEHIKATNILFGVNIFGVDGTVSGMVNPNPWDLRYGVIVGSTVGKLKLNCRNMVDIDIYDNVSGLAAVGADRFDSIDDYGQSAGAFPSTNPWQVGDEVFCGFNSPNSPTWERVITNPVTNGNNSIFEDKISGLKWTRGNSLGTKNWDEPNGGVGNGAIEYCHSLDHGGINSWRLPTHKELLSASVHGIRDLDDSLNADSLGNLDTGYWSSTTNSFATANAFFVFMGTGVPNTFAYGKNQAYSVLCVAP